MAPPPIPVRELAINGLWKQNPGLVQLLGLCPILAISTSMVNAVSLGMATIFVMLVANLSIALLRQFIPYEIRIPVFILVIASVVTVVDLAFNAWFHGLYLVLGLFIPLIVTNCIVLARVEAYAAKNGPLASTVDAFMMGMGLLWVLALLGGVRELIAQGTLFSGIDLVFSELSPVLLFGAAYEGPMVFLLPPGAFFALGALIALFNGLNARRHRRLARAKPLATTDEPVLSPSSASAQAG